MRKQIACFSTDNRLPKEQCFLKGFQASASRPSEKSSSKIRMNIECPWNDNDWGKDVLEKICPSANMHLLCETSLHDPWHGVLQTKIHVNYILRFFVPHNKHSISILTTNQFVMHRGKIAVCSQIHMKHIKTLCGQNVSFITLSMVVSKVATAL